MLPFSEKKALEAATYLLTLSREGMDHRKLELLLYLVDRKALTAWGHPITTASFIATGNGVELSDRISILESKENNRSQLVQLDEEFVWKSTLSGLDKENEVETSKLSEAEMLVIEEIFAEYVSLSSEQLQSHVRVLPEVQKCGLIYCRDILKAAGRPEEDISIIEEEIRYLARTEAILERIIGRQDVYGAEQRLRAPAATYATDGDGGENWAYRVTD